MTNKETHSTSKPLPWYSEGLKFKCTGCGKCCTGTKGFIFVTESEMNEMATFLEIPIDLFKRKYTRMRNNRYALIEKKSLTQDGDYDCIFLKDKKCAVYAARPIQCRTYPWWQENLNSKESFELAALDCEGISSDAPIVPYDEIQKNLNL